MNTIFPKIRIFFQKAVEYAESDHKI